MAGINVDASDGQGRTPIFCILDSEKDAVRSYGFDEQEFIDRARTPGFDAWLESWSVKREVQETKLRVLIDAGADINRQRRGGRTLLHDAAERNDQGSIGMLKILVRQPNIKVDVKDGGGRTPLSSATYEARKVLLSAGASITQP